MSSAERKSTIHRWWRLIPFVVLLIACLIEFKHDGWFSRSSEKTEHQLVRLLVDLHIANSDNYRWHIDASCALDGFFEAQRDFDETIKLLERAGFATKIESGKHSHDLKVKKELGYVEGDGFRVVSARRNSNYFGWILNSSTYSIRLYFLNGEVKKISGFISDNFL